MERQCFLLVSGEIYEVVFRRVEIWYVAAVGDWTNVFVGV